MRAIEFVTEASGYIPKNSGEAKDPRYSMALSVDVHNSETANQGKKFGFDLDSEGRPPKYKDGKPAKNSTSNKLFNLGIAK